MRLQVNSWIERTWGRIPRAPATNALKTYHDFRTQRNVISHEPNFYSLQKAKYHSNVVTSKISFHETLIKYFNELHKLNPLLGFDCSLCVSKILSS